MTAAGPSATLELMSEEILYLIVLGVFTAIVVVTWLAGGVTVFWAVSATIVGLFAWVRLPESDSEASD